STARAMTRSHRPLDLAVARRPGALGEPQLEHADLARRLDVVGHQLEDLAEVVQRELIAPEHALDPAEVEPRDLGRRRAMDRLLERAANIGGDAGLVGRRAELRPAEQRA